MSDTRRANNEGTGSAQGREIGDSEGCSGAGVSRSELKDVLRELLNKVPAFRTFVVGSTGRQARESSGASQEERTFSSTVHRIAYNQRVEGISAQCVLSRQAVQCMLSAQCELSGRAIGPA